MTFALLRPLAGIAAMIWTAQRGSVDPMMGFSPVQKAFIITALGGLGSLGGTVLDGLVIGILEGPTQAFLPDNLLPYRDVFCSGTVRYGIALAT